MAYYPQNATGLNYISYPIGPSTFGINLAANGSANAKGSYVQFVASSTFTSNGLIITTSGAGTNTVAGWMLDFATGAAASEVDLIPNLFVQQNGGFFASSSFTFNLNVAISTRVAMRTQSTVGSGQTIGAGITLIAAGGIPGAASYLTYGASTGSTAAAQIDAGGTANTKGAYVQVTASTSAVSQQIVTDLDWLQGGITGAGYLMDLATGGSGSEVVLIPDLYMGLSNNQNQPTYKSSPILTYIPASTRIAARGACSSNAAASRVIQLELHTAVAPSEPSSGSGGAWAYA